MDLVSIAEKIIRQFSDGRITRGKTMFCRSGSYKIHFILEENLCSKLTICKVNLGNKKSVKKINIIGHEKQMCINCLNVIIQDNKIMNKVLKEVQLGLDKHEKNIMYLLDKTLAKQL